MKFLSDSYMEEKTSSPMIDTFKIDVAGIEVKMLRSERLLSLKDITTGKISRVEIYDAEDVAVGDNIIIILAHDSVWTMKSGIDILGKYSKPVLHVSLPLIEYISAGGKYNAALSKDGKLYIYDYEKEIFQKFRWSEEVVSVSCRQNTFVFLTESGDVFMMREGYKRPKLVYQEKDDETIKYLGEYKDDDLIICAFDIYTKIFVIVSKPGEKLLLDQIFLNFRAISVYGSDMKLYFRLKYYAIATLDVNDYDKKDIEKAVKKYINIAGEYYNAALKISYDHVGKIVSLIDIFGDIRSEIGEMMYASAAFVRSHGSVLFYRLEYLPIDEVKKKIYDVIYKRR